MDENMLHNRAPPFQARLEGCALHQNPNNRNNHPARTSEPTGCGCKREAETSAYVRIYFF